MASSMNWRRGGRADFVLSATCHWPHPDRVTIKFHLCTIPPPFLIQLVKLRDAEAKMGAFQKAAAERDKEKARAVSSEPPSACGRLGETACTP